MVQRLSSNHESLGSNLQTFNAKKLRQKGRKERRRDGGRELRKEGKREEGRRKEYIERKRRLVHLSPQSP